MTARILLEQYCYDTSLKSKQFLYNSLITNNSMESASMSILDSLYYNALTSQGTYSDILHAYYRIVFLMDLQKTKDP